MIIRECDLAMTAFESFQCPQVCINKRLDRIRVQIAHRAACLTRTLALSPAWELYPCQSKTGVTNQPYQVCKYGIPPSLRRAGKALLPAAPHRLVGAPINLQKTPGGNPPALGGPSIRGIHPFYTTNRNVDSILPNIEHMFYITDTNICSPYRKAA